MRSNRINNNIIVLCLRELSQLFLKVARADSHSDEASIFERAMKSKWRDAWVGAFK